MTPKVLSLGQCAADHYAIARLLEENWGCAVVGADTAAEAWTQLRGHRFDLVLVNRILDADGGSGLAFIAQLKKDEALTNVPVMLVSNYPDAQREAIALGALPGFGKASLADPATRARLRPFLETKE